MIKVIAFFALTFGMASAHAADCAKKAEDLATKLDVLYSEMEGPFQGDNFEPVLTIKEDASAKTQFTFSVDADHINEDGESWVAKYEIKLGKEWCELISFKYLGSK